MKALLLVLLASFVFSGPFANARRTPCMNAVDEVLLEAGVEPYKVIKVDPIGNQRDRGPYNPTQYRFWIKSPVCNEGYVVVRTTAVTCRVLDLYTQWGCDLPE